MKKFHKKKKSQEETPILLKLGRRHTIENDVESRRHEELRQISSRSSSVSTYEYATKGRTVSNESSQSLNSGDNSGRRSTGSNLIITESELSSSWLYKNMKAKINLEMEKETRTETSNIPENGNNDIESPDLEPGKTQVIETVPSPKSKKQSKCCCCLMAAFMMCICALGIIAAIGGIIYLEVFANSFDSNNPIVNTTIVEILDFPRESEMSKSYVNSSDTNSKFNMTLNNSQSDDYEFEKEFRKRKTVNSNEDTSENMKENPSLEIKTFLELDKAADDKLFESSSKSNWFYFPDEVLKSAKGYDSHASGEVSADGNHSSDEITEIVNNHEVNLGVFKNPSFLSNNLSVSNTSSQIIEKEESVNGEKGTDDVDIVRQLSVDVTMPAELVRRLGMEPGNDVPATDASEDIDVRSSIAEAIKHLRVLDVENKLPHARAKTNSVYKQDHLIIDSIQDIDVSTERSEYLNKLRKIMYE